MNQHPGLCFDPSTDGDEVIFGSVSRNLQHHQAGSADVLGAVFYNNGKAKFFDIYYSDKFTDIEGTWTEILLAIFEHIKNKLTPPDLPKID